MDPAVKAERGMVQTWSRGDALYLGSSGRFRQAGPVTGRADFFLQEFSTLHVPFVFNLREGIFNGIDSVVVGEVEFTGFIGIFDL